MSKSSRSLPVLFTALLAAAGCDGPILTVRHVMEADLPAPRDARGIAVGRFAVVSGPDAHAGEVAEMLKKRLRRRIRQNTLPGDKDSDLGPVIVTGEVRVEANDRKGTRTIRRRGSDAPTLTPQEVETLVRTVAVRVDFVIARRSDNARLGAAETRRRYSSLADPRVRGDLGLGRPDDPARVPAVETVVRELLAKCVETFCRMITPPVVAAEVPLRGTLNSEGARALAAAREKDFPAALAAARSAARAEPNDVNLLFNLAAIAEACGELKTALDHYEQVVKRTGGRDTLAAESALRVKRVINRGR